MYRYKYYIVFNLQQNLICWSVGKILGILSRYWGNNCIQARPEVEVCARLWWRPSPFRKRIHTQYGGASEVNYSVRHLVYTPNNFRLSDIFFDFWIFQPVFEKGKWMTSRTRAAIQWIFRINLWATHPSITTFRLYESAVCVHYREQLADECWANTNGDSSNTV
jgi:hypothetical protein